MLRFREGTNKNPLKNTTRTTTFASQIFHRKSESRLGGSSGRKRSICTSRAIQLELKTSNLDRKKWEQTEKNTHTQVVMVDDDDDDDDGDGDDDDIMMMMMIMMTTI